MAANILPELGIREPLYVTAMKYAGVNITSEIKDAVIFNVFQIIGILFIYSKTRAKKGSLSQED